MPPAASGRVKRFLTFRGAGRLYAIEAEAVREIVQPTPLARVPLSPKALLGLANLRGAVVPVASLPLLLGRPASDESSERRVVVLQGRAPFGLMVDEVVSLVPVAPHEILEHGAHLSSEAGEILKGAFDLGGSSGVARILDIEALLASALGAEARLHRTHVPGIVRGDRAAPAAATDIETFITFEVASQEYALPLGSVREVLPTANVNAPLPKTETAVLGLTALRNHLLPLMSMRALLGFPVASERSMTLVAQVAGVPVGLAVDAVRDIVRADPWELEPVPPAIAGRAQGETGIDAVLKLGAGERLIAILAPDRLFREDVMNRIKAGASVEADESGLSKNGAERIFLVFSLGDQEFGLAVSAVEEVARLPEEITRLPKAPDFLRGVVNLRGTVLPVIDQRRRFDLPPQEGGAARRLVAVRVGETVAGFIVDAVSELLRVSSSAIDPPPDVVGPSRVLEGVINLESAGRMVLLLDPSQLLSRTEQGLLDALGKVQEAQAALDQGPHR